MSEIQGAFFILIFINSDAGGWRQHIPSLLIRLGTSDRRDRHSNVKGVIIGRQTGRLIIGEPLNDPTCAPSFPKSVRYCEHPKFITSTVLFDCWSSVSIIAGMMSWEMPPKEDVVAPFHAEGNILSRGICRAIMSALAGKNQSTFPDYSLNSKGLSWSRCKLTAKHQRVTSCLGLMYETTLSIGL